MPGVPQLLVGLCYDLAANPFLRSMPKSAAIPLFLALSVAATGPAGAQDATGSAPAGRDAARIDVDVRMMRADEVRSRSGDSVLPPEAVGIFVVPQAALSSTGSDAVTTAVLGPPGGPDFEAQPGL